MNPGGDVTTFQAIVLGIVQGLGEFLPISSSAHLVVTPDYGFGRQTASYWAAWKTDVRQIAGAPVDQVISFRHPSYAVQHPAHVCWLNHTMREYYDLWPQFVASISPNNRIKETVRRTLTHAADRWLLRGNVSRVVAQSHTIQQRLVSAFNIHAGVLWPPPPPRAYRCEQYGDYIFAASRLMPLKRMHLLVRALAEPAGLGVRAVIAGKGDERVALEQLAMQLHVATRVTFSAVSVSMNPMMPMPIVAIRMRSFGPAGGGFGGSSARASSWRWSPTRVVATAGTVEAFASRKAVITCTDSGGPTELVRDGETGFVCEPTPASLAAALARVTEDAALAERLGAAAAAQAATMTWADAVKRLVIV